VKRLSPGKSSEPTGMGDISESNWKIFKPLRGIALQGFCERVLAEIARIGADGKMRPHERYCAIFKLVRERDREIVPIFDHLRRSTAVRQICAFRSHDLLTDEERRRFRSLPTPSRTSASSAIDRSRSWMRRRAIARAAARTLDKRAQSDQNV